MFENKNSRYITSGANETLSIHLQVLLWDLIDTLKQGKSIEIDYLQIFKFNHIANNDKYNLSIIHSQEVPPYEKEYLFYVDNPINEKIYVIDSEDYETMLLSQEY
ncbi:DUF960 family protein [Clostridium estertheticum]|uniref:DUF960 family protein n=1 Tax=Clostridium estertheticum TaxID=238834 RepID=UPI001CF5B874|nr:DUF960 family protein [Clostridium estertheticum]MCB2354727.1 DUF960 domain-containing protein [Clostridium estertheticum]WAG40969.1 DUF960 domain-containing protein [Clostridium estertheticum]